MRFGWVFTAALAAGRAAPANTNSAVGHLLDQAAAAATSASDSSRENVHHLADVVVGDVDPRGAGSVLDAVDSSAGSVASLPQALATTASTLLQPAAVLSSLAPVVSPVQAVVGGLGLDLGDGSSHPAWLDKSPVLGVFTTSANAKPLLGDGLVDGVVVRVAPQFAVTSTYLLSSRGLTRLQNDSLLARVVVFHGGAANVTRVLFESDFSGSSDDSLVVLELDAEPADAPLTPVVTSKPNKDFEYELLTTVSAVGLLDTVALRVPGVVGRVVNRDDALASQSKLTFFEEPMCGYSRPAADDDKCVTQLCVGQLDRTTGTSFFDDGRWRRQRGLEASHADHRLNNATSIRNNSTRSTGSHHGHPGSSGSRPAAGVVASALEGASVTIPAVLLYDDELVGISIPVTTPLKGFASLQDSKQGFVRLAASAHRRFLDFATNETIVYDDDDVFSKASKYPSYLATFVDADGAKLPCQGVLIASRYVLTTASCLAAQPTISAVQFFASDVAQRQTINVVRDRMTSHPRYTLGDVTFDTAVVALETDVAFAPIQLDDGSADTGSNSTSLARIQMSDDQCLISATTAASGADACKNRNGNKFRLNEAFCVLPVAAATTASVTTMFLGDSSFASVVNQPVSSTTGAALVMVNALSNVALVGLGVPAPPASSSSSTSSEGRSLEAMASGEVYVRVANSATFINAYVAGVSWSGSSLPAEEGSVTADLPAAEQFIVGLRSTKDGQNFCGGSLVGPTSVLTAAHCVVDGPAKFVSVGANASSGILEEVIAVVSTKIHSSYGSPHQFSFDVAILELDYPSVAAPVLLDDTADFTASETATMYGYGMTSATSGLSPTLRAVTMPLWSEAACKKAFGDEVDDSMLCAGGQKGKDACTGDSGSPLVVTRSGRNVLVGVVSAGAGCGTANVPGVYARVHSVKDFVRARVIGATWAASSGSGTSDGGEAAGSGATAVASGTAGAATPSSSSTPASIEAREASDSSTNEDGGAASAASSQSGPYTSASVALGGLSPLVREALMDFLIGADSEQVMAASMIASLKDAGNAVRFYSTASLAVLAATVSRHNESARNARKDRFGQWASEYADLRTHPAGVDHCVAA